MSRPTARPSPKKTAGSSSKKNSVANVDRSGVDRISEFAKQFEEFDAAEAQPSDPDVPRVEDDLRSGPSRSVRKVSRQDGDQLGDPAGGSLHPASLYKAGRSGGASQLAPPSPSPPPALKHASYSRAVSDGSLSDDGESTLSSDAQVVVSGSLDGDRVGDDAAGVASEDDGAGSLVDFIDDRAEEDLSEVSDTDDRGIKTPPPARHTSRLKRKPAARVSDVSNVSASSVVSPPKKKTRNDADRTIETVSPGHLESTRRQASGPGSGPKSGRKKKVEPPTPSSTRAALRRTASGTHTLPVIVIHDSDSEGLGDTAGGAAVATPPSRAARSKVSSPVVKTERKTRSRGMTISNPMPASPSCLPRDQLRPTMAKEDSEGELEARPSTPSQWEPSPPPQLRAMRASASNTVPGSSRTKHVLDSPQQLLSSPPGPPETPSQSKGKKPERGKPLRTPTARGTRATAPRSDDLALPDLTINSSPEKPSGKRRETRTTRSSAIASAPVEHEAGPDERPLSPSGEVDAKDVSMGDPESEEDEPLDPCAPVEDPWFKGTYDGLPDLSAGETIPTFSSHGMPPDTALIMSEHLARYDTHPLGKHLKERMRALALLKVADKIFVNPARAPLDSVQPVTLGTGDKAPVYVSIPKSVQPRRSGMALSNACLLTHGVSAFSSLNSDAIATYGDNTSKAVHKFGMWPFEYEYQRTTDFISAVTGRKPLYYDFEKGALVFTTKPRGASEKQTSYTIADPSFHSGGSGGTRTGKRDDPVTENHRRRNYLGSLQYTDKVPIYDARLPKHLTGPFTTETLLSLPRYPFDEVPNYSLVTVGYTANTYVSGTGQNAGKEYISFNVRWVVVHATKPE